MQKVLRKRILRDLKENSIRYLALGALIILCMYIIVSLLGTADTLMIGIEKYAKEYKLEDGQFTVFAPLSENEKAELEGLGITLEEQFYLDYQLEDMSTLRVFQNRKEINLVKIEQGRTVKEASEVILEKRYCEEHELQIGDSILIDGKAYEIVGIGCTPDYDSPLKDFSDSNVNSLQFGNAFVTKEAYKELLAGSKSLKAEEYIYAYRLNDALTNEELKDKLSEFKIEADEIEDVYFQEYWIEQTKEKEELQDGIKELTDGSKKLADALDELATFKTGIELFDTGLTDAADGAGELADGTSELQESTDEFLDEYFSVEINNLIQFVKADDNPRIGAAAADQLINKYGGLIAGVIVIILFAYVISVFVVYGIEKENSTIGALYALGVKKKELIKHYLCLPVTITFIAGIIGSLIGFSSIGGKTLMGDSYAYFSIPQVEQVYPAYLLVYAIVMPPVIAAVVNRLVIGKKLNRPALSMIRNEQKQSKISNMKLGNLGFITKFRIRQMLREIRTAFTVLVGMFISLLILMLGVDCYVMCAHISDDYKEDTQFEYMYTYKYPETTVPEGGYEAYAKTMKKENLGYNLDVTVLGLTEENPFFDAQPEESKSEVVISSAMAEKYRLKIGDIFVLEDEENEMNYAFTVKDIAQYATSFYVFMDIDSMRALFGEEDDYYNVVFADKELDIPSGRLYAVTTREDVVKASDVFIDMLKPMVTMMVSCSALIFAVVMYLMMKVMIDRSAFHISMVKVFGYRMKEIKKLYLNGNFYIIAIGAAICIPLAKLCMDAMYPVMVSNIACGMNLAFSWQLYAVIYVGVILLYFVINQMLVSRLKKVNLVEVLKNRE